MHREKVMVPAEVAKAEKFRQAPSLYLLAIGDDMDCRKSLVIALLLLTGSVGCSQHSTTLSSTVAAPKSEILDPEALKRQPKPETFVAYGDYSAHEADFAKTPAEQEQLRDRARRAYQEALKEDPANLPALKSLARLYVSMNDFSHANAVYDTILKLVPSDASLWFESGMSLARAKQWDPALEHMKQAVELDPENRSYIRYLGFALARAGRYDESLAAFTRYEGEAKAHFYLAQMLEHLQQKDLCKSHLQIALTQDPNLADAAQMLMRLNGLAPSAGTASATMSAPGVIQPVGYSEAARPAADELSQPATLSLSPPPNGGK